MRLVKSISEYVSCTGLGNCRFATVVELDLIELAVRLGAVRVDAPPPAVIVHEPTASVPVPVGLIAMAAAPTVDRLPT